MAFLESLLIAFLCLKEEIVRNQIIFLMNSWFSEMSDLPVKEWWFLRFLRGPQIGGFTPEGLTGEGSGARLIPEAFTKKLPRGCY